MTLKTTEKNAIICVKSSQEQNGEITKQNFQIDAKFRKSNDKYYIFYKENEKIGIPNCFVMLIIDGEKVTMRRDGVCELVLDFEKDLEKKVRYFIAYGSIDMTLKTESVDAKINDDGGYIDIDYMLDFGGQAQKNRFNLTVDVK